MTRRMAREKNEKSGDQDQKKKPFFIAKLNNCSLFSLHTEKKPIKAAVPPFLAPRTGSGGGERGDGFVHVPTDCTNGALHAHKLLRLHCLVPNRPWPGTVPWTRG